MNPNSLPIIFLFIAIATILSFGYGRLVKQERLPFNSVMAFNDTQWQFMKVWVNIALLLGVILPSILWIFFWDIATLRNFFSCYLFVVAVQLICETYFSRLLCKSVVVIIGTLYTGFRIWQLWTGLQFYSYSQPWLSLYWLVVFFWIANMIMLTTMAIPSILPKTNRYGKSS